MYVFELYIRDGRLKNYFGIMIKNYKENFVFKFISLNCFRSYIFYFVIFEILIFWKKNIIEINNIY